MGGNLFEPLRTVVGGLPIGDLVPQVSPGGGAVLAPIAASIAGASSVLANITGLVPGAAAIAGASSVQALLRGNGALAATLAGASTTTANVRGRLLNLDATPQPTTLASYPSRMRTGAWTMQFTSTLSSAAIAATNTYHVLFNFQDANSSLDFLGSGGACRLEVYDAAGALRINQLVTFGAGQTMTVVVNPAAGTLVLSGATTGTGSFSGGAWTWGTGQLGVCQMVFGGYTFAGSCGSVYTA